MAETAKVFGKTKIIDTGTVTKIQTDGDDVLSIDHATGNINLIAGSTLSAPNVHVNASTGATEKLYVDGASKFDGVLRIEEQGANTNPSGGAEVLLYMKGDKLVIAFDHGGTAKYRTLDLTGTDGLWAYSTSAP